MAREKKFNFDKILMDAPERVAPTLSIYKNGQLMISADASREYGLDGLFVDIVWDQAKRVLGLKVLNGTYLPENEWTKTMRKLEADDKGVIKIAIGKITKRLGFAGYTFKELPLEKHVDLLDSRKIYYVEIPEVERLSDADLAANTTSNDS